MREGVAHFQPQEQIAPEPPLVWNRIEQIGNDSPWITKEHCVRTLQDPL